MTSAIRTLLNTADVDAADFVANGARFCYVVAFFARAIPVILLSYRSSKIAHSV
jgi:hypothetical protein